ncbi:hypothetical protein EYC80_009182 [Monilinia laxa]|uniref:Uncharacterized protein n=1 Tax=Monilinia laxa TaxID=61186 RepID=A0A5N6K2R7_MONLA|nr:hypothetical protein EYC80_009182 [Monilinia laxa]
MKKYNTLPHNRASRTSTTTDGQYNTIQTLHPAHLLYQLLNGVQEDGAWLVLGRRRGYDDQRDLGIWGFACGLGGVGGVGGSGGDDDDDDDDEGSLL